MKREGQGHPERTDAEVKSGGVKGLTAARDSGPTIPKELQSLVYWAIKTLGLAIKEEHGAALYRRIESIRKAMKSIRSTSMEETVRVLHQEGARLRKASDSDLFAIAHSFAVMLELINRCESAYRTHRIRQRGRREYRHKPEASIFVFTAHPTEARSPEILYLFQKITLLLEEAMQLGPDQVEERLFYLLRLTLKVPMSRERKPTVRDEADYLYSFVLSCEILDQQIAFSKRDVPVWFRSWVGGDKDGHPDVDESTMLMSLGLSRRHILAWLHGKLDEALQDLAQLGVKRESAAGLFSGMGALESLEPGDGRRVSAFTRQLTTFLDKLEQIAGLAHPLLGDIRELVKVYPALVLPLELREDSELVREASRAEDPEARRSMAIVRMLDTLNAVSDGLDPKWYARSLILSMVMTAEDLRDGHALVTRHLKGFRIPVVPLLENAQALENAVPILEEYLVASREGLAIRKTHQSLWERRFEVMLGYSDSSKESGVLSSRYLIHRAMKGLDPFFRRQGLKPVYFHGSGGSIERGGGSIREQTSWWPASAVRIFKATVQGEMVARNFGSSLVMRSQIEHIMDELSVPRSGESAADERLIRDMAEKVKRLYQERVAKDDFFEVILQATPYNYLDVLKIGSRPSKRQTASRRLRAIPWVLCWTQTRVLFPTWWGIGSAYEGMADSDRKALRNAYASSQLLSSFIKILGFTLRKVELPIWRLYLERLGLPDAQCQAYVKEFQREYDAALAFFHDITGKSDLLWHRPWLGESIHFRSSMIHPLNLVQIEALRRQDDRLLRETVTGIACGMMTTG